MIGNLAQERADEIKARRQATGARPSVAPVVNEPKVCRTPWFGGLTCDHIYEDCPNRARITGKTEVDWSSRTGESLDPHGTDVCGLCLHRHNRAEHQGADRA